MANKIWDITKLESAPVRLDKVIVMSLLCAYSSTLRR